MDDREYILQQVRDIGWRPHLIQNVIFYLLTSGGFFSSDEDERVVDNPELDHIIWSENPRERTIDVSVTGELKLEENLEHKIDIQVGEVEVPVFSMGPHGIGASYEEVDGETQKTERYQSFYTTPLVLTIVGSQRRPTLSLGGEILVKFVQNIRPIEDLHDMYRFRPVKLGRVEQMEEIDGQWASQLIFEVITDVTSEIVKES